MSDDYYFRLCGEIKGPYSKAQLKSMWDQGLITTDAQYWTQGMADWYPISGLLDARGEPPSSSPSFGADAKIPTVSVDLQSVSVKRLDFILSQFTRIFGFATTRNIRTIRASSEKDKQLLMKVLRKEFRSIKMDERIPEVMPPIPGIQFDGRISCPKCGSRHTHVEMYDSAPAGCLGGLVLGGLLAGATGALFGAGLGSTSDSKKRIFVCHECGQREQLY